MKKRIISLIMAVVMLIGVCMTGTMAAEENGFTDVEAASWYEESVAYAVEQGYMQGFPGGLFKPDGTMTRAMVVTVLYRMAEEPDVTGKKNPFVDVADGEWYAAPVIWGASAGIVNGKSEDTFAPMEDVTREQLVSLIARYAASIYVDTATEASLDGYADSDSVQAWAAESFAWAVENGLVKGVTETELRPRANSTRAQFATILKRFDEALDVFDYEIVYSEPYYSRYTEKEYPLQDDADLFVSPDGDDSNPGTKEKPLATMEGARRAVLKLKETKTGDIKVAFMAGVYNGTNVVFTAEDSGNGGTVTYCSYGDGDVEFNNGLVIDAAEFEDIDDADRAILTDKFEDSVKKYDLNGIMAPEDVMAAALYNDGVTNYTARYPNRNTSWDEDSFLTNVSTYEGKNKLGVLTYIKKRVDKYRTFDNVYIYGYLCWDFYYEMGVVDAYDSETGIFTLSRINGISGDADQGGYWPQKPFIIVNVSEELDTKGEYYIDPDTMTLYVYDPSGTYELAYNTEAMVYFKDASDITVRGIDFSCSAGDEFLETSRAHFKDVARDGRMVRDVIKDTAALVVDTASANITVDDCSFSKMSNVYAVFLDGFNTHFTGNEIYEVAGGGIYSDSADRTYLDNLISTEKLIDNNFIHNNGHKYQTWQDGIYSHDVGVTISHNEFRDLVHYAIKPDGIETIIEYNVITECNQIGDGGAVYTGQCHTRVGNTIRYNIFANNPGGFHIYLDDGLAGMTVYGNIFYSNAEYSTCNVRMLGGRENKIYDNILINNNSQGTLLHIWAKYYEMAEYGDLTSSPTWNNWMSYNEWPTAGSSGEQIWKDKYPWLFEINYDTENWRETYTDPKHFTNPDNCVVKNNYAFVNTAGNIDYVFTNPIIAELGEVENNVRVDYSTNPVFVNPARGDYRIREDYDKDAFGNLPEIPVEQIGRY